MKQEKGGLTEKQ